MRFLEWFQWSGQILHGNNYLWSVMEMSSVSRTRKFTYFQILWYVLGRWIITQHQINTVWEEKLSWFKSSPQYRILDTIDGEPMEFEWTISPRFTTLHLIDKVQELMTKMGDPSQFQGRIIFMSMFIDIIWRSTDNERECIANATFVTLFAKKIFPPGRWSFFGLGSEKKCYSTYIDRPRREWDRVAEIMMIKFRESGHQIFRATSPLSRERSKQRRWKTINTFLCRWGYDWNFFSHFYFCCSAQYLRSSFRFVWGIQ